MKKILNIFVVLTLLLILTSCKDSVESDSEAYQKLVYAEDFSGLHELVAPKIITKDGPLNLPTEFEGVKISYKPRPVQGIQIIDENGVVTRPDTCWIQSKDQQGVKDFPNLNDNWPVVIDVTYEYKSETKKGKLLMIVAPKEGFTCNKYLGNK